MIVNDIISEASQAQKKREKEQRQREEFAARQRVEQEEQARKEAAEKARLELARRKFAAKIRTPEPPPPVEEPAVDPNNPLAALYAQQQAQEREQEDEIYGVDFKFQTVVDKKNRTKRLYGFWTKERIQRLEDVMRSRQYVDLGNFTGGGEEIPKIFALFKDLGLMYRQVYIFFDHENMRQFPGLAEVLRRMNDAAKITKRSKIPFGYRVNPDTNEIEQYVAWEEVDRPPESFVAK